MYTPEQLKEAVQNSICWSDVCRELNITICSFNFKRAQKLCKENSFSTEHFDIKKAFRKNKKEWTSSDIYRTKSVFPRAQLRRKVLSDEWLEYKCFSCGNSGEWLNKKLTLEIEHVNGINDDHRKENLKWLCPNCHSQTYTYRNNKNRTGLVA